MIRPLEKPCIFIISTGRTATQFFGYKMADMIQECTSEHEPDVLWLNRPQEWYRKIKRFGGLRMTLGRLNPRYSLRALNVARHSCKITDSKAIDYIKQLRISILRNLTSEIYLEANSQYNGLVDLLPLSFPNSRIAYIIRDPRSWVRSWMDITISLYSWRDIRSWFKSARLTPHNIRDDPYRGKWSKMSQFEKLCWLWNRENSYALECVSKTDAAKIFRFEDLFDEKRRNKAFPQLLKFVTSFPNGFRAKWLFKPDLLSQKVHSTSGKKFPKWTGWSNEQAKQLDRHCGALMQRFNYDQEPDWREKLNS